VPASTERDEDNEEDDSLDDAETGSKSVDVIETKLSV
jgi:hypothetical protein